MTLSSKGGQATNSSITAVSQSHQPPLVTMASSQGGFIIGPYTTVRGFITSVHSTLKWLNKHSAAQGSNDSSDWWKRSRRSILLVETVCILIKCQVSVKRWDSEHSADTGKHMQLWKVQPCNTSLTLTIRPTDPFPFSLPHFLFLFYFLFSHGCRIQSSTSLLVYSVQHKGSRLVLCGPEESMPLKKTAKEPSCSLSMVIEFLNIFSKSA